MSAGSCTTPGTTTETVIARPRVIASSRAEPTSIHQCGRRSRMTTSLSLSSRRGNGTGVATYGATLEVGGTVVVVACVVVVTTLVVVVRAVVVVWPVVLVDVGTVVVGAHAVLPTAPAAWNGTCTTFETTLRPARSAGTVAGAASATT